MADNQRQRRRDRTACGIFLIMRMGAGNGGCVESADVKHASPAFNGSMQPVSYQAGIMHAITPLSGVNANALAPGGIAPNAFRHLRFR